MEKALRKAKEAEILNAAASTSGQPGGQIPTGSPFQVKCRPVARLRATAR